MVEKQASAVNISDTGVLSKDDKETDIKGLSEVQEVTDYWDISGAMDTSPGSADESSGKMKLHTAADETAIDEREPSDTDPSLHDNVNSDSATAGQVSNAMQIYCENGQSAISEYGQKSNLNNNNLNHVDAEGGDSDTQHKEISKNSVTSMEDMKNNNPEGNPTTHLREHDIVGTDTENNTATNNDVSDTAPNNTEISGAKDNGADGDNKTELSIRDEMMLDSECTEERFRIDRKKLEQMLQAATEGRGQSGEEFFQKIMDDTKTYITWPSKLKIGAKSKKDPHIRICGKTDDIKEARQRIMLSLDTKSNRVTIKMDVSHTEHSHVIGKGGNNIKRVMQETGCHIHFPDSNRNNASEKSNQVSITGHPEGVENARLKIRNLLPIVLQFEIPSAGLPMPDINSPMIQHLVQAYGISIQFKQRVKVYSTSCTVRGSADNIEGLKTGIQTLMNHIVGSQLPVTTQIEVAPQHHPYMLSKTGVNVNTIIQSTGARIIFPDPNALPKKSTVYINGSIDSVILARHKLMGCLPLLLMFDIKSDTNETNHDSSAVAQLMESLDIFINIKLKPKQPSKTVIIKGMEYNIYNMFEARAKLLGLESNGVTRPTRSLSPKLSTTPALTQNPVSPVILLARSHVSTPTVQTHIIGLTEQKAMAPLPVLSGAVLSGPGYVLTHSVPSNPGTPRPLSALAAVHTPSQSPYPTIAANGNLVQGLTSPMMLKDARECVDRQTPSRTQEEMATAAAYGLANHNMSPPSSIPMGQTSIRPSQNIYVQNTTVGTAQHGMQQYSRRGDVNVMANDNMANIRRNSNPTEKYGYQPNGDIGMPSYKNQEYLRQEDYEAASKRTLYSNFTGNLQNVENSRVPPSTYNSTSTVPNQYTSSSITFHRDYQKGMHSIPSTFSPLLAGRAEDLHESNRQLIPGQLAESQLNHTSQFPKEGVGARDENLLRQHYSVANQVNSMDSQHSNVSRTPVHGNLTSVHSGSANSLRQSLGQNIYSPDSITGSRTSLNSDRLSPMSSISDRFIENPNPRLGGYDQFEDQQMRSPPSPASGIFQPLVKRDINSLSPMNAHTHRSPPHIIVNQSAGNKFESHEGLNETPATSIAYMYNQQQINGGDVAPRPPPGFEGFAPGGQTQGQEPAKNYENLSKLAKKAMENKPVTSEVRTPTDVWAGWGFSKSMPFEMREELKKLAASKGRFKNNLATTYENGDDMERGQPSPLNEEDEDGLGQHYGSRLRVPFSHQAGNSKGGSSLKAWRQRNVMNLSLGGHMGLNFIPGMQRRTQKPSAFTPIHPNERVSGHSSSPKTNQKNETLPPPRPVNSSPFSSSGNERTLSFPRPEKPAGYDARISMSSTPTIQDSLGLNASAANKVEADIPDVLNRLDLAKYISVFQQQEVDFQTFLTLTEPDLKELGITTFGPRKKILLAIKDLNKERDVFSGPALKESGPHENLSDQMLQLQRLQLQQHRDNPQTTTPSRLDTHALLSPSRQLFPTQSQYPQNHLDVPVPSVDRRGVFHDDVAGQNVGNERMRQMNASRLWQNSKTGISNSGRW